MQHNFETQHGWILFGFTSAMAVALTVNAAAALLGSANLAWWHYPWLAVFFYLTKVSLTKGQIEILSRFAKNLSNWFWTPIRQTAACLFRQAFSITYRAVRTLSALFNRDNPKIQTEP